jgi:translation initiation factor 2B subunit (eIF-2B alpha/beta/delta family)
MKIPEVEKKIENIATDRLSGASEIAQKAAVTLDLFAGFILKQHQNISPNDFFDSLLDICIRLIHAQPTMAPVLVAVNDIASNTKQEIAQLNNTVGVDAGKQLKYLCTFTQSAARKYIFESNLALDAIAGHYADLLSPDDVLMTLSSSRVVECILNEAFNNDLGITVYVPESRPMFEGRKLAEHLARSGIETILIADSAMFHYLKECNGILVGADRITPHGLMNKIGTYGLAMASKELNIPFYCVAERRKFIPDVLPVDRLIVNHPAEQLYKSVQQQNKPEKLSIQNIYFDFTPMEYVTKFLTEDGIIATNKVKKYIDGIEILPELVSGFIKS